MNTARTLDLEWLETDAGGMRAVHDGRVFSITVDEEGRFALEIEGAGEFPWFVGEYSSGGHARAAAMREARSCREPAGDPMLAALARAHPERRPC